MALPSDDLATVVKALTDPFSSPLKPGGQPGANPVAPWLEVLSNPGGSTSSGTNPSGSGGTGLGDRGTNLPAGYMAPGPYTLPVSDKPGGGKDAPFGGSSSDGPPMWLAKNALAAYQSGDTKYRDHLLNDPTIKGDYHLYNFVVGLFAGAADKIAEAKYYSTNPSYNGWNNAAGNGIPGDGL